jgi:hypothetical protein
MKQAWNVNNAEVMVIRSGELDFENVIRESLLKVFQILRTRTWYSHTFRSLFILDLLAETLCQNTPHQRWLEVSRYRTHLVRADVQSWSGVLLTLHLPVRLDLG